VMMVSSMALSFPGSICPSFEIKFFHSIGKFYTLN
jgi:hypothetical protein